jgi:hypothetical protein
MSIRLIIIIIIISWMCFGCQTRTLSVASHLEGFTLSVNWDFQEQAGAELRKFEHSVDIIHYDNLIMYRDKIPLMQFGKRKSVESNDTVYVQQELIEDTTEQNAMFFYFIYKEGNQTGIRYDSDDESLFGSFNVDSLLRVKSLKGAVFYAENDSLVYSETNSNGFDLFQVYVPKLKIDASYCDTTYMYFSKLLDNVSYSFSPVLDNTTKIKLAKVIFVYNPGVDHAGKSIAARKMISEIKPLAIKDTNKIIALFERYKKETKTK